MNVNAALEAVFVPACAVVAKTKQDIAKAAATIRRIRPPFRGSRIPPHVFPMLRLGSKPFAAIEPNRMAVRMVARRLSTGTAPAILLELTVKNVTGSLLRTRPARPFEHGKAERLLA